MRTSPFLLSTALALVQTVRAEETGCPVQAGLSLRGFVDASYAGNLQTGGDAFHLDQVELDLEHQLPDGMALRADLESRGDTALAVEQGWLSLPLPFVKAWRLTVGTFNAPLGAELLDAPDMHQSSHSLLFDYGLPVNLTGVLAAGPLAGPVDLKLFAVNGWDVNDEGNASRSLGLRAGLAMGLAGSLGLAVLTGREEAVKTAGAEDLRVIDLDYLLRPRDNLLLLAEVNLGRLQPVGGATFAWTGWMAAAHLDFNEIWGCTLRGDQMADPDGVLFGRADGETRSSLTTALTCAAGPSRTVLLEARMDISSAEAFPDGSGGLATSTLGVALEFTQSF